MTPTDIAIIRDGFRRISADPQKLAAEFYARLFAKDPELRGLFTQDMKTQGAKLVSAIALVVHSLDRLELVLETLRDLGRRHATYGVLSTHYDLVGEALIETLASRLGPRFDARARGAWMAAYTLLAGVMDAAAQKEAADLPEPAAAA